LASEKVTPKDLIDIAIGIEKQGIAYYDVMAASTWHEVASDLFRHLAGMERSHVETFKNMFGDMSKSADPVAVTAAHAEFIKTLVENAVFTDEMAAGELAEHVDNEDEAIDIAISAEKESLLFYYTIQEDLPETAKDTVNKILAEEKSHLAQLSGLRQKLLSMR
jgi:rubrerythrin